MPSIALYYPWMHFQSDDWVKLALLTWDGVARMRAIDVPVQDSDLVRKVSAESDLIIDVAPNPRDLDLVTTTFRQVIDEHGDAIAARHRHGQRSVVSPPVRTVEVAGMRFPLPGRRRHKGPPSSFWVYCGGDSGMGRKMSYELRCLLVDHGLAVESARHGKWLGMEAELAAIYLAVLAETMGRHNAFSPVTDDPRVHFAPGSLDRLTALLLGEAATSPADVQNSYLHVALQAVIEPRHLADVPVARIIRFREKHTAELAAFRAHVAGLGEELTRVAEIENLEVAQRHLEILYRQQTEPQLDELRRALRGLGVESTAGALALRIGLTPGTAIAGLAAMGGQLAVAGAAVAVSVVPYVAAKLRERRDHVVSSPVAYLLAANRELAGKRLLRP